ncbi:MAG: hypothetical protein H6739_12685 [Alphaproteobacteria bacterium]|nr:hypothetical protein [Alphaproteobacteria bacterium]
MRRTLVMALGLAAASPSAWAAWPDDVNLSSMSDLAGRPVLTQEDIAGNTAAYETVVRELGVAIANKPLTPADTLGVSGFEVLVSTTVAFTSTQEPEFGVPGPWGMVQVDEDPTPALILPRIEARKGLPFSFDVGAQVGWVGVSRQTVFGGYGRWAPLEGYRQIPDVSLQLGYSGYVGNEELELGVMDFAMTISYELAFGSLKEINSATFTPYGGFGRLWMHAEPRLGAEEQQDLGVRPVSGFKNSTAYEAEGNWSPYTLHGGFRIVSQHWEFKAGAVWAPKIMPTINVGMGFHY